MTHQETIIRSGLALRDFLARNPEALSVTLERPDGEWTMSADGSLTLCVGDRRLDVPAAVFDAAWEVVG